MVVTSQNIKYICDICEKIEEKGYQDDYSSHMPMDCNSGLYLPDGWKRFEKIVICDQHQIGISGDGFRMKITIDGKSKLPDGREIMDCLSENWIWELHYCLTKGFPDEYRVDNIYEPKKESYERYQERINSQRKIRLEKTFKNIGKEISEIIKLLCEIK